jgi:hypothetical protein
MVLWYEPYSDDLRAHEAWAEKLVICIAEGHDFVRPEFGIWLVCSRCGCRTPGSFDGRTP